MHFRALLPFPAFLLHVRAHQLVESLDLVVGVEEFAPLLRQVCAVLQLDPGQAGPQRDDVHHVLRRDQCACQEEEAQAAGRGSDEGLDGGANDALGVGGP